MCRAGIVKVVCPLHDESNRLELWKQTRVVWPLSAPVDAVQAYYGEQVAIYFAWLDCLTSSLIVPSVLGVYVWLARDDDASVDTDTRTTCYSFFMVRKPYFLRHLYIKTIVLSRQARDKHRKSTPKSRPFFCRCCGASPSCRPGSAGRMHVHGGGIRWRPSTTLKNPTQSFTDSNASGE